MSQRYNHLFLGDCIEELSEVDAKSFQVDLVFADPPYNIGYTYDVYNDKLDDSAYLRWTERWMEAASYVLKSTGTFWIAIGDEYVAEIKSIGEKLGFVLRNWVVWYYTFGVHCTRKFSRSHTHLLYFVKDPGNFTFNDGEIRVPSARQLVYNDGRADRRGRVPDNTWIVPPRRPDETQRHDVDQEAFNKWILRPQDAQDAFHSDHDTWYFARVAGTFKERAGFHGCQLPERLLERIIRCCSNPDDVVLDPFAGSGSTLIVAKKLGRRWVGYEISPDYVRHAGARISSVRTGDPIEGPLDPLSSAPSTPRRRGTRREATDERGIVEAFKRSSEGYSADRVIADPILNAKYVDQCSLLGLAGRPSDWNLTLLALRKGGKLTDVSTTRRTQLSWQSMDPFEDASEIALRQMLEKGYPSLDHVLSDPLAAARFDEIARSLAPGFSSLQYRWAALRLRKDARLWRRSSKNLDEDSFPKKPLRVALDEKEFAELQRVPAVYVLSPRNDDAAPAYVGETWNLLDRVNRTFHTRTALDQFVPNSGDWQLKLIQLDGIRQSERRGLQSLLIGRNKPVMNYLGLAGQQV